jgi:leucyl aminopeptidase
MEPNYSKIFNEKMMQTVSAFCSENEIKDIDGFILKCFKQGFDIKKYGFLEKTLNEDEKDLKTGVIEEKQLIKEVIVEKRVEVPVEIIKEVIIEKEIIKEVPVEKIVTIYDKSGENELGEKIARLEHEMSKKNKELDELRQNLDEKLDDTNQKMLQETLQKLRKELTEKNEKIKELIKINQDLQNTRQNKLNAVFLRGSNINDTI